MLATWSFPWAEPVRPVRSWFKAQPGHREGNTRTNIVIFMCCSHGAYRCNTCPALPVVVFAVFLPKRSWSWIYCPLMVQELFNLTSGFCLQFERLQLGVILRSNDSAVGVYHPQRRSAVMETQYSCRYTIFSPFSGHGRINLAWYQTELSTCCTLFTFHHHKRSKK